MIAAKRILAPGALSVLLLVAPACNLKTALSGRSKAGSESAKPVEATPPAEVPIPAGRFEVRVLTADWCIHSHPVPEMLVRLRGEFPTVRFREFDSDVKGNAKLIREYDVDGYPYFVLLDGGRVIHREAGLPDFDEYKALLKKKIAAALAGRL